MQLYLETSFFSSLFKLALLWLNLTFIQFGIFLCLIFIIIYHQTPKTLITSGTWCTSVPKFVSFLNRLKVSPCFYTFPYQLELSTVSESLGTHRCLALPRLLCKRLVYQGIVPSAFLEGRVCPCFG